MARPGAPGPSNWCDTVEMGVSRGRKQVAPRRLDGWPWWGCCTHGSINPGVVRAETGAALPLRPLRFAVGDPSGGNRGDSSRVGKFQPLCDPSRRGPDRASGSRLLCRPPQRHGSRRLVEWRIMIVREQEEEGEKRVSKEDRDTPTCGVDEYRYGLKMGLPGCGRLSTSISDVPVVE